MTALNGVAIVTGAAGGIGRAIALKFAEFGCTRLTIVDLNEKDLQNTGQAISSKFPSAVIFAKTSDLSMDGAADVVVNEAVERFQRVDYLVNCAGIPGGFLTAVETSLEIFDQVQQLNVRGTWLLQRAAIKQMLAQDLVQGERGSIVNVGSSASHVGMRALSAYVTSKHAILGMTRADAVDYASNGIRINCVCPGVIDTNLGRSLDPEINNQYLLPAIKASPMRRVGRPEEVANCVVFLCSSMASYVTGTSLAVDGGFLAA